MKPTKSKPRTTPSRTRGPLALLPVLLIALLIALSGCSLAGSTIAPPKDARGQPVDGARPCTRSLWLPLFDTVGVAAGLLTMGIGLSDDGDSVMTTLGAGTAATYLASTIYGATTLGKCTPAKPPAAQTAWIRDAQPQRQ